MDKGMQTLIRLIVGNLIYAAVVSVAGVFFVHDSVQFILGVFWSAIGAGFVAIHMYCSLQKSLDMGSHDASKRESGQAVIRMMIMIMVVVVGLMLPQWLSPYGVILGMFALKVSAYVQPFFIGHSSSLQEDGHTKK